MHTFVYLAALHAGVRAASFRTVGSSGCTVQMSFLVPFTDTIVFLDNYHRNYGGPGVDLTTGAHSPRPYMQNDSSGLYVFGVEYSWRTNALRKLHPRSNTFCAAGAFFPDGTMVNVAGAETRSGGIHVHSLLDGRQALRRYKPGPCNGSCDMDFTVDNDALQSRRWYPTAITLGNGDILVVGGSDVGLLVTNEAAINNPTYELIKYDGTPAPRQVKLDILDFTSDQNQNGNYSYNLYPTLHVLPDATRISKVFTLAGNRVAVHDYLTNERIKDLPEVPLQPRCFPSSATVVMLPLSAPAYEPEVLVCGGSSTDAPDPQALDDCYRIKPNDEVPLWQTDDKLPNGPQHSTDGILLPDGNVLFINGAHKGCSGGFQAEDPVYQPLIYNPTAPAGDRFTKVNARTQIPRLYHSVAQLLPSGEVIVAGSNPAVFYANEGKAPKKNPIYPRFTNNGHISFLHQQQARDSNYSTEYRVEMYAPDYVEVHDRPKIQDSPKSVKYGEEFSIIVAQKPTRDAKARISYGGFRTHAVDMGQRMVELQVTVGGHGGMTANIKAPSDCSIAPPGVYLLWYIVDGIPSEGKWIKLEI